MKVRERAVRTVNISEARTHLSRLVDEGEEIVIARAGRPVARLVPILPPPRKRMLGIMVGAFSVPPDFDEPLPQEVIDWFLARDDAPSP